MWQQPTVFPGNRLLGALPLESYERLLPDLESVRTNAYSSHLCSLSHRRPVFSVSIIQALESRLSPIPSDYAGAFSFRRLA